MKKLYKVTVKHAADTVEWMYGPLEYYVLSNSIGRVYDKAHSELNLNPTSEITTIELSVENIHEIT